MAMMDAGTALNQSLDLTSSSSFAEQQATYAVDGVTFNYLLFVEDAPPRYFGQSLPWVATPVPGTDWLPAFPITSTSPPLVYLSGSFDLASIYVMAGSGPMSLATFSGSLTFTP